MVTNHWASESWFFLPSFSSSAHLFSTAITFSRVDGWCLAFSISCAPTRVIVRWWELSEGTWKVSSWAFSGTSEQSPVISRLLYNRCLAAMLCFAMFSVGFVCFKYGSLSYCSQTDWSTFLQRSQSYEQGKDWRPNILQVLPTQDHCTSLWSVCWLQASVIMVDTFLEPHTFPHPCKMRRLTQGYRFTKKKKKIK